MKPTQPDIDWALANRDLVARWLEKRGGWQWGAFYMELGLKGEPYRLDVIDDLDDFRNEVLDELPEARLVWLPSVGDALEMLEAKGIESLVIARTKEDAPLSRGYFYQVVVYGGKKCYGQTRLVALCELLKAVDDRS